MSMSIMLILTVTKSKPLEVRIVITRIIDRHLPRQKHLLNHSLNLLDGLPCLQLGTLPLHEDGAVLLYRIIPLGRFLKRIGKLVARREQTRILRNRNLRLRPRPVPPLLVETIENPNVRGRRAISFNINLSHLRLGHLLLILL